VRSLWGPWWALPGGLPALYVLAVAMVGDLRPEHLVVVGVACILAYGSVKTKQFFVDVSPYLAVAIGYDAVRYAREAVVTSDRVMGCGLRDAEVALFHVGKGVTVQDYLQQHTLPALDLIFAVPYAVFAYLALAYAAYLYFVDRPRMRHYLWAFAIANYISFAMWLILPAAPPWYIRAHGCVIDIAAQPSPAGLARVDALLGTRYFATFYSRASSVYGAMPSMHCAYPVLGLLTAWKAATWKTRPLHILYTVLMFSAAVYLDHHWILDGLAGWVVALIAVVAAKALVARMKPIQPTETPPSEDAEPASQPA
jgi:membrane-associated phospholipid phosphatase